MNTDKKPIRVLQVVCSMDRGGLETWIMYVMRRIDRQAFHFDFCVEVDTPCAYDQEIVDLGGTIKRCVRRRWQGLRQYPKRLAAIIREGNYDVVHVHRRDFAGISLWVAAKSGIPHRFAHMHSIGDGCRSTLPRVMYRSLMRGLVNRYATRGLGCSSGALESFFGSEWKNDPRMDVVFYGVDCSLFEGPPDGEGVRAELNLPGDAPLMIHVGRFIDAKNHGFLVDIFRSAREQRGDLQLVLVGEGPLRAEVSQQVQDYGLADCVHFLGLRSDVPRLLKAADVMVMPSTREGMPVTMLEATAAGLPIVVSDLPGTQEANDVCCRATILPVERPAGEWASAVIAALSAPRPEQAEALERVRQSPFSSEYSAQRMAEIYRTAVYGEVG